MESAFRSPEGIASFTPFRTATSAGPISAPRTAPRNEPSAGGRGSSGIDDFQTEGIAAAAQPGSDAERPVLPRNDRFLQGGQATSWFIAGTKCRRHRSKLARLL